MSQFSAQAGRTPSNRGSAIRAEAVVDLDVIESNVRALVGRAAPAELMAVVKADGYGHGAVPVARAAVGAGAAMLGVATPHEAVALRRAGIAAPLLAWLWVPGEDVGPAVAAGVAIVVSSAEHLAQVEDVAATAPSGRAVIHLKVDTGLGRNGVMPAELPGLAAQIAQAVRGGTVVLDGVMSHLACADEPGHPATAKQITVFREAVGVLETAGLHPRWRHLANTAATIDHPDAHFDLVRAGIGVYGLSPVSDPAGLVPAMTLRAQVALAKRVPAGQGVSYGLTYTTTREATLALIPLGYADGIPRNASSCAQVLLGGRRRRIAGRVAMDQFVVDCGDDPVAIGDEVLLFGPGTHGEPTAREWAEATGTIDYEIVTRIGPRVPRRYVRSGREEGT